jgi:hypothetical protein
MNKDIARRIASFEDMTVPELREAHAEICGEPTASRHKGFIRRKLEWALQARAEGSLSQRARRRAQELVQGADLRLLAPEERTEVIEYRPTPDRGLPPPGTTLERLYKGRLIVVTILNEGVDYEGERFTSLTAVARKVTGSAWSGHHFFGLRGRKT